MGGLWPFLFKSGIRQNEIQHCADQGTPSIRRETNYVEQDESEETENQNMGPQGLADEGERIHSIVDEMEAEDQTAIEMEEYEDSSDDEQYSLPKEWKEHGFGSHVAEDVRNQEWEYRGNEVVQGATYPNIEAVKDAVRLWAISLKREFRVVKSGSKEYEVKCVNDGCPWRVHAFKGKWKSNWKCSIVTEHTCLLSEVLPSHRNISCDFVAKQMYGFIMDNLNYEPKMIVRHIEQTYQYTISYLKAWRAKQRVFEMRFGTYEASYDNLPRMLSQVAARNPGSFYDTYLLPDNETFTLDDFDSLSPEEPAAQGDPDVLGYSQLGGAPLGISQQQTPQPLARPERQVRSPDVLTYSEGHVRAQQRAKRVRRPRGG